MTYRKRHILKVTFGARNFPGRLAHSRNAVICLVTNEQVLSQQSWTVLAIINCECRLSSQINVHKFEIHWKQFSLNPGVTTSNNIRAYRPVERDDDVVIIGESRSEGRPELPPEQALSTHKDPPPPPFICPYSEFITIMGLHSENVSMSNRTWYELRKLPNRRARKNLWHVRKVSLMWWQRGVLKRPGSNQVRLNTHTLYISVYVNLNVFVCICGEWLSPDTKGEMDTLFRKNFAPWFPANFEVVYPTRLSYLQNSNS